MRGVAVALLLLLAPGGWLWTLPAGQAAGSLARYEGEDRVRDAGPCEGGERMGNWTGGFAGASNGKVLAYVSSGCWAEWDVVFEGPALAVAVGAYAHTSSSACYYRFDIQVDGVLAGSTPTYCGPFRQDGPPTVFRVPLNATPGAHTVRLTSRVVSGSTTQNEPLDFLEFELGCGNKPPGVAAVRGDGLHDGFHGWNGASFPYVLEAVGIEDPDGDPVQAEWRVEGGSPTAGSVLELAFGFPGLADVREVNITLRLTDDPSLRCPTTAPRVTEKAFPFTVVPGLGARLRTPALGLSCNAGDAVPSWASYEVIAERCVLAAAADTYGGPAGLLDTTTFLLDGAPLGTVAFPETTLPYASLAVPDGPHELGVCATAAGDKYARTFCSPLLAFHDLDCGNRAPAWGGARADGMLAGFHFWRGFPYTFTAADLADPDGDPLTVRWAWGAGTVSLGATTSRSFAAYGLHQATVTVTDDPSLRCPQLPPRSVAETVSYEVVPEWQATLDRPFAGKSCVADRQVTTPAGLDNLVAGWCAVWATATAGHADMAALAQGRFRVDQAPWFEEDTASLRATYVSVLFSTDVHRLDACFGAQGDKHARSFCSLPYDYFNVGT